MLDQLSIGRVRQTLTMTLPSIFNVLNVAFVSLVPIQPDGGTCSHCFAVCLLARQPDLRGNLYRPHEVCVKLFSALS